MFLVLAVLLVQGVARASVTVASCTKSGISSAYLTFTFSGLNLSTATSPTDTYTLKALKADVTAVDSAGTVINTTVALSGSAVSYSYNMPVSTFVAGRTVTIQKVSAYGTYALKSDGSSAEHWLFTTYPALSYSIKTTTLGNRFDKGTLTIKLTGTAGPY